MTACLPNNAPPPNRRPLFPLGSLGECEYLVCAPPASPVVVAVGPLSATTMITTRSSTPEDADAVSACVDAVSRERRYLGNTSGFSAEQTRAFIASLAESGGIQIVVVADSKIVGWCDVTPMTFEGMHHVGRLGMGLIPSFRGQGLGRRLVREALSQVFAKTLQRVELEVFASNKIAVGLYEREGFVIEGRKRRARLLDGGEDDILIMGCLRDEWRCSASQQTACSEPRDGAAVSS
jgi:RimJ/RimL family protein N-acetyltransferase